MGKNKAPRKPPGPQRPALTHFLCLPLVTAESKPQLQASLAAFSEAVSAEDSETALDPDAALPTIHPKAIRPVGALHCTLGVMSLDAQRRHEAVSFLNTLNVAEIVRQGLDAESTPGMGVLDQPIQINLKGLQSMHTPSETSILYSAPSDPTNRLLPVCLSIQKLFQDENFLVSDDRELKLHVTIVNTIYAKSKMRKTTPRVHASSSDQDSRIQGHGPNAKSSLKIDATAILEKFKDFSFAENVVIDRVAICEMGAKKVLNNNGKVIAEEYTEVAHIKLPT
nr:hypothetical protein CFP56_57635 [Quercus suber]